ncbi:hypothetical protein [Streptococcus fryi]
MTVITLLITISKIVVLIQIDKERLLVEGHDYEFVVSIEDSLSEVSISIVSALFDETDKSC